MGIVIIPFDYEELPYERRNEIVPICIASIDCDGRPIAPVWFERGVVPVQEELRDLARYKLRDVGRVSELAEVTVHKLWRRHGEDAGHYPWRRVLTRAIWEARDMAKGGSPWFVNHSVPLALDSVGRDPYRNGPPDPTRYDDIYELELLVQLVERRIEEDRREDIREMFKLLRRGFSWEEIAVAFHDPNPEAVKKRFWRWVKRRFRRRP